MASYNRLLSILLLLICDSAFATGLNAGIGPSVWLGSIMFAVAVLFLVVLPISMAFWPLRKIKRASFSKKKAYLMLAPCFILSINIVLAFLGVVLEFASNGGYKYGQDETWNYYIPMLLICLASVALYVVPTALAMRKIKRIVRDAEFPQPN